MEIVDSTPQLNRERISYKVYFDDFKKEIIHLDSNSALSTSNQNLDFYNRTFPNPTLAIFLPTLNIWLRNLPKKAKVKKEPKALRQSRGIISLFWP
jgi:hypothetical protein